MPTLFDRLRTAYRAFRGGEGVAPINIVWAGGSRSGVKHPLRWLIGAFVVLEIVRRVFSAADCYVDLTYSKYRVGVPHAESRSECVGRHVLWPLRF